MQHMKLKLAAAITALLSTTAMADTWEVIQTTTPGSDTTINQTKATGNSVQSLNTVNYSATGSKVNGTQTAAMTDKSLTLNQKGATANSTQAANYATGTELGVDATNALTQKYTGTAAINLNQKTGELTDTGNLQAVNTAKAGTITNLKQEIGTTTSGDVTLTQSAGGANTQAINNAEATTTLTTAAQDVSPDGKLILEQSGTSAGTQAANRVVAADVTGALTQDVKVGTDTAKAAALTQTTSAAGTQALNMASVGKVSTGGSTVQSVKGQVTMKQGDTAKAGDGSLQAGNYLKNTGTSIKSATQHFGDSTADLDLQQKFSSAGTVQAGNHIDMGSASDALTSGTQNIANGAKNVSLTQSGGGSATQAGNLLTTSSNTTSAVTAHKQTLSTTGTLKLEQSGTASSLQAGNAVLVKGTGGGKVTQEGTMTTLAMNQGLANATTSGSFQAVNYVGQ